MPYRDLSDGQILAAAGGFATILRLAFGPGLKVQEGKAFTLAERIFAPWSDQCCMWADQLRGAFYEGFPPQLCGALSGMAGWGGTRVIRLLEVVLQKRLGLDEEDLK